VRFGLSLISKISLSNYYVEDEKVSLDELQEKIAEFEDYVQSTDVAAMQSGFAFSSFRSSLNFALQSSRTFHVHNMCTSSLATPGSPVKKYNCLEICFRVLHYPTIKISGDQAHAISACASFPTDSNPFNC
jgi:hypothetical protein